jgi:hypothetical protein
MVFEKEWHAQSKKSELLLVPKPTVVIVLQTITKNVNIRLPSCGQGFETREPSPLEVSTVEKHHCIDRVAPGRSGELPLWMYGPIVWNCTRYRADPTAWVGGNRLVIRETKNVCWNHWNQCYDRKAGGFDDDAPNFRRRLTLKQLCLKGEAGE